MKTRSCSRCSTILFALLVTVLLSGFAGAAEEKVVYRFTGGVDGGAPYGGLTFDSAGNFYGTTTYGGNFVWYGEVFQATRVNGHLSGKVIYSFDGGLDGQYSTGNLVVDPKGNIFGTTQTGGFYGYGTVFELSPKTNGQWKFQVIYNFEGPGNGDGEFPYAGVILDKAGNLYGTTNLGGPGTNVCPAGCGTVYELTHSSKGWQEKQLYVFTGKNGDGAGASNLLSFDKAGNLYGTTSQGGSSGQGIAFQLVPGAGGTWTENTLWEFGAQGDGAQPYSGLTVDSAGNLYGTTSYGGSNGLGTVFEITPSANGWAESVIWSFGFSDGAFPQGNLLLDRAGNLYGTTTTGGGFADGIVYELSPSDAGWNLTELYSFNGSPQKDGNQPLSGVVADSDGRLWGTTNWGGYGPCAGGLGCGIIFELVP